MVERFASYIVGLLYRPADCHPILFLGCSRVDCARTALKVHHILYITFKAPTNWCKSVAIDCTYCVCESNIDLPV